MDYHALGLVDDQQILVLVYHIQWDILCNQRDLLQLRQDNGINSTCLGFMILFNGSTAEADLPLLQELLYTAPCQVRQLPCQKYINAFTVHFRDQIHNFTPLRNSIS